MARKTKEEALVTRSKIIDAAERLFHARGVSRTSLNDIALSAGVTRGAVYWHFKDKADVFNAMMDRVCMPLEESAAAEGAGFASDPLRAVCDGLAEVFRLCAEDEQIRRVFEIATLKMEYVDELLGVRDKRLQVRGDYMTRTERAFEAAQKLGHIATGMSARTLAIGLHALVDGLIQNWILDPTDFDIVRVGRDTVDTYLAGRRA